MDEHAQPAWRPIGSFLLRKGLISPEQLELALLEQQREHRRLGEILVEWGWVSSRAVAEALSEQHGIRFVDLVRIVVDDAAARLLDEELAERYEALPVQFLPNGGVLVAVADPTDAEAAVSLRQTVAIPVELAVADRFELLRQQERVALRTRSAS